MKSANLATVIVAVLFVCHGMVAQRTEVSHTEWSRNAVIYEANIRQSTPEGTFNAYSRQLPRLKSLGVDIIWVMPIHPISVEGRNGELGSYYAVQDYAKVNPEFGTLGDFKELVTKAHKLGMKVIIDWVANHTGLDNVWVKSHPDFYVKDSLSKMVHPYNWTDTYKLDYANKALRTAMTQFSGFF
jgi:alpha-amylase